MAIDYHQGPKMVHPEEPSAVGSRNSLNRDGRDEYVESRQIIDEEVDKILNHVQSKLPPEVLQELNIMGNIKSNLHTYFNQSFQNMVNRYLTTVEDELAKKVRDLLDKEEHSSLNRYTPREMAALVNSIGGSEQFNTGEVEKSMVNIMGHLQGHVQRGMYEVEARTTNILMRRTDVGGFVRGENAYSVVKCSFRDSYRKPDTVRDIKLAINVLDAELISSIVPHQMLTEHLFKTVIAEHIQAMVNREVNEINQQLTLEGRPPLSDHEALFEKIKTVENYTDDEQSDNSKRYQFLSRALLERIEGLGAEVSKIDFDPIGVRESIAKFLEDEHLRTRGWYTAINSITSILDSSRMGYQHIHNFKNARHLQVREYQETDVSRLPDERYEIDLKYYDSRQIREEKVAYSAQLVEFRREIMRLWNVVEQIYQEEKANRNIKDWDALVETTLDRNKPEKRRGWFAAPEDEGAEEPEEVKAWNEVTFIQRRLTSLEEMNQTYTMMVEDFEARFNIMRHRLAQIFDLNYPDHRMIVEGRLNYLEDQFLQFMSKVNPYHVQPGLLLEVTITSIKRGQITIKGMANVLNEYLLGISKGFTDRAISGYHRRSHVSNEEVTFQSPAAE
jgi:hypothetical protein